MSFFDPNNFYHKIYWETCPEFEEIRELCLSETDNWLRDIYLPENLIIEKHRGYSVVFHKASGEPAGMAGLFNDGRYPSNIARHLHREYLFPKFRVNHSVAVLTQGLKMYHEHIIKPLDQHHKFDAYFVAMQTRDKKSTKGYWNRVFSRAMLDAVPGFRKGPGLIQTCPWPVQKCWQNFVYFEHVEGAFDRWSPQVISENVWKLLDPGS
jgi:hypothetical protein